jgi:hypothetical protein
VSEAKQSRRRPRWRRLGRWVRVPDPKGTITVLRDRDIVKLMTPTFWEGSGIDLAKRLLYCAHVALMAFCYISPWIARTIQMEDWRPGGLNVVRIKRDGELQTIPVCDEAVTIVERYIEHRRRPAACTCPEEKPCCCGPLFVSPRLRKELTATSVRETFERAAEKIGLALPLADLALRFCERKLEEAATKDADRDAARRFMGYRTVEGPRDIPLPHVPFPNLVRIARRSGRWCKVFGREFETDRRADENLEKPGTVPRRRPRAASWAGGRRATADEHPLIAELMAIAEPEDEKLKADLKRFLRKTYLERLDPLVLSGLLGVEQASELLLTKPTGYYWYRMYHLNGGRKRMLAAQRGRVHKRKPKGRRRPNTEQSAILALLKAFDWPKDEDAKRSEMLRMVALYFLPVDAMIRARLISLARGRDLIGVTRGEMQLLRAAVREGVPVEQVLTEKRHAPISKEWSARIEAEHAKRPAWDRDDRAFYFRMCREGFDGSNTAVWEICQRLRPPVAELNAEERGLLDKLRGFPWPAEPEKVVEESEKLLAANLPEAKALLDGKKIGFEEFSELFRISKKRRVFLLSALEAGLSVEQALRPRDRRPLSPQDWAPALQIIERAPDRIPVRQLYFRAAKGGFPGSEDQFRAGAARFLEIRAAQIREA